MDQLSLAISGSLRPSYLQRTLFETSKKLTLSRSVNNIKFTTLLLRIYRPIREVFVVNKNTVRKLMLL